VRVVRWQKTLFFPRNRRRFCDRSHQKSYPETAIKTRTVDAMECCLFSTELGWSAVIWSDWGLKELKFGHLTPAAALSGLSEIHEPTVPSKSARRLVTRLQRFAKGINNDEFLDVELDTCDLTDFGQAVTTCCRRIAAGTTMSYGELAATAGYPGAARAVGSVMRRNRWPLIVPCHRVVAAGGRLGGFSAPNGPDMKRRLLNLEGSALVSV
jgi:methylated-DNA-[protein]-cysteine S-methyltransferase